jgi:hypothetical protein
MTGFLATLAIAGAFGILSLLIVHFSSAYETKTKTRDLEELKRKLFNKIEEDVREVRKSYVTEDA